MTRPIDCFAGKKYSDYLYVHLGIIGCYIFILAYCLLLLFSGFDVQITGIDRSLLTDMSTWGSQLQWHLGYFRTIVAIFTLCTSILTIYLAIFAFEIDRIGKALLVLFCSLFVFLSCCFFYEKLSANTGEQSKALEGIVWNGDVDLLRRAFTTEPPPYLLAQTLARKQLLSELTEIENEAYRAALQMAAAEFTSPGILKALDAEKVKRNMQYMEQLAFGTEGWEWPVYNSLVLILYISFGTSILLIVAGLTSLGASYLVEKKAYRLRKLSSDT